MMVGTPRERQARTHTSPACARRGRRAGSPPTYLPVDEAASGELLSNAQGAKGIRARLGARRSQGESAALSLHLDAKPILEPPTAPEPDSPDPEPERARIEQELGIVALTSNLTGY